MKSPAGSDEPYEPYWFWDANNQNLLVMSTPVQVTDLHANCVPKDEHLDILELAVVLLLRNGGVAMVTDREAEELFERGDWSIAQSVDGNEDSTFVAIPPEVVTG